MNRDFYQELGRRVGDLRRAAGLTQEALAERAGVGASYIARIEIGGRKPTLDVLCRVAEALSVPLWRLVADERLTSDETARKGAARKLADAIRGLPGKDIEMLAALLRRLRGR